MTKKPIALPFDPPGPGPWEQDPVHLPRPMTRYFAATHPAAFRKGTKDFSDFYGLLIDHLDMGYVNGFGYLQVAPAKEEEFPQRFKRAEEALSQKLWREQLRDWEENRKPASVAKHRELQSINPDTLSDADLAAYLKRCHGHHSDMLTQHMRFSASAMIPTGNFLAHASAWTGLSHADLLELMRDSAVVSKGGSSELARLKKALANDKAANDLLVSNDDPAAIIANLRGLKNETGAAFSAYVDLVGYRLIDGFDIAEPSALEMPDAFLRAIRIATLENVDSSFDLNARIAEVRAKVPAEHQGEFDELLEEARLTYHLRDERGVYSDVWASGIMRRAALSAGRRCVARGQIKNPEHMLDADIDEMCALVLQQGGPSAEELENRALYRATYTAKDAPPLLGPEKPPPGDMSKLPPAVQTVMGAISIALSHLFGSAPKTEHKEEKLLVGLAASKGVYEGPARRVSGPAEFGRIAKGDVLITESTTEAFNILLPLLGGIVTDNGGLLSHAAIVAREYGIPGVVGTSDATVLIADGVRVRVDGDTGEVKVLE